MAKINALGVRQDPFEKSLDGPAIFAMTVDSKEVSYAR